MTIQFKTLNDLKIARENTRKSRSKDQIKTLAESITSVGLLHTLVGYEEGETTFISDGGSRLKALRLIAKKDDNFEALLTNIPVNICTKEQALDISLSANLVRNAMTPAEQFTAFHKLHNKQGVSVADIAKRYYVDSVTVRRILKLAELAKPIFQAFKQGEISLDVAKVYAGCNVQERQLAVFETCGLDASASMVRRHLRKNTYLADSALVKFVTLDAYKARGGVVEEDLFESKTILPDGHIIDELMIEATEAHSQELREQGWSEVFYFQDRSSLYDASAQYGGRIFPDVMPNDEQQARLDEIESEIDDLGNYWNLDASEQSRHEALTQEHGAIEQAASSFTDDVMANGVCLWSFSDTGVTCQNYALADEPVSKETALKEARDFSESFERNVMAAAGDALMEHLTRAPSVATFAMMIAALEFGHFPMLNVSTRNRSKLKFSRGDKAVEFEEAFAHPHGFGVSSADQIDRIKALMQMSEAERYAVLAGLLRDSFCMGETCSAQDDQLAIYDFLSGETEFSLADYWTFSEEELRCLTKAQLLRVIDTMGYNRASYSKAKKSELVIVVSRLAAEKQWLPEFVRPKKEQVEVCDDRPSLQEAA